MKKSTLLILLLLTFSFGFSQTTLVAGDVAITGANGAGNPDEFSFVLLTDVLNGTVINFTDCGVTAAGTFRNLNTGNGAIAEGIVTWTATSDLSCGTEIIITETANNSNTYTVTTGTVSETDAGFTIGATGDQLIAFQGTTLSPNFIFAIHFANGLGWATDAIDATTSTVPTGLSDGTNAVAITVDVNNIIYDYTVLGDSSAVLGALADSSKWSGSNAALALGLPGTLTFDCDNPVSTTTLIAGDIAITGANANNPDEFSFVILTDVSNGTKINFTDAGWTAAGAFRNLNTGTGIIGGPGNEGVVTWIADSDLPCGTEIIIAETAAGSNVYTATTGSATETDAGFALGNGDQIIAFQGTTLNPNFVFALHFADGLVWASDATDVFTSTVPTGLTDGVNAVAVPYDTNNISYSYTTLGDSSAILAALVDPFEWVGSGQPLALGLPSGLSFDCDTANSTTALTAGEIAITGVNTSNPDEFSFVLLTDVSNRTTINFSDGGWTAAGDFLGLNTVNGTIAEGIVTWTATTDLPCGTEIIIAETAAGSNIYTATSGTATETDAGFALPNNGDQIIAFQGAALNPNFIFALHFGNGLGWAADAIDTTTSTVPAGLTDGVNAVAIPIDTNNIIYDYTVLGDSSGILEALVDAAKWIDSTPRLTLGLPGSVTFDCDTVVTTTTLIEGNIAITGANSDNPNDEFSFVLLTDVTNGTTINFTDKSWDSNGTFILDVNGNPTPEGVVTWTATSDLPCGTEIIIAETANNSNIYTATSGTAAETEAGFALQPGGDQIIAYQGSLTSPQFIYAFHFANNNGWTDATDINNSAVPAGLTEGINAVAVNFDNAIYDYSVIETQTLILVATSDSSNWDGSNGVRQTLGIPAPDSFSCSAPTACPNLAFWISGAWSTGILPDISTQVFIFEDYDTSINPSFSACTLNVAQGVTLTVANDTFIVVQNGVSLGGDIIVQTRGNFVQNDASGTISGTGTATLNKTTPTKNDWFYYTYWSSPMADATLDGVFPLVASDRRYSYNAANFVDNAPTDEVDDNGDDWEIASGIDTMIPGVGYAVTAENSGTFPRTDDIQFTGTFNTGDIVVPITYNPTNLGLRWNFIGNPYPSAIDFVAFHLANASVVEGAAYFWSQAEPPLVSNPGNDVLNFSQNDYAVFTVGTGGAAGGSPVIPNGYVPSAQGFFIPALASLIDPNQEVTFKNTMRTPDNTSNNQFFKGSNSKKSSVSSINPLENRLWVNLTTDNGVFNQILVGYVENGTDAYDGMAFDAPKLLNPGFAAALYSTIANDDNRYMIQGKGINTISEDEVIQLGFISTMSSDTPFTLSIEQFQGAFLSDNTIYLKDNLLDIQHDLSDSDYTFTSEVGEFNSRFEIVFNAQSLSTDDIVTDANTLRIIELYDDQVQFNISNNLTIKSVSIYDLLGRQLYNFEGNTSSETYKLSNLSNTAYIAKVELSNGAVITKKMIKK